MAANDQPPEQQSRIPNDIGPIDEAESQMRKALALLGDAPRHRPAPERSQSLGRPNSSSGPSRGGLQRRRFIQDGDVPVTILRREQTSDPRTHRPAPSGVAPTSSRLQRVEAALAAETAAREKAERALTETHTAVRDLQTKIGHADLVKDEAVDVLQHERIEFGQMRIEFESLQTDLQTLRDELQTLRPLLEAAQDTLAQERKARKAAENAQELAEAARADAERLVRTLPEAETMVQPIKSNRRDRTAAKAVTGGLFDAVPSRRSASDPEPVKRWLNAAPAGKRR
jgi:hypothetical protein